MWCIIKACLWWCSPPAYRNQLTQTITRPDSCRFQYIESYIRLIWLVSYLYAGIDEKCVRNFSLQTPKRLDRTLGRTRFGPKNNKEWQNMMWLCGLDIYGSRIDLVPSSCRHYNITFGTTKGTKFMYMRDYTERANGKNVCVSNFL